jgi:hypothetical protein
VSEKEVNETIRSFPTGLAGGPNRFRPQHLRNLTSDPTFGPPLIAAITGFVNILRGSRYSDNRYSDNRYSDNHYSDNRHSDNRYSDIRYSDTLQCLQSCN